LYDREARVLLNHIEDFRDTMVRGNCRDVRISEMLEKLFHPEGFNGKCRFVLEILSMERILSSASAVRVLVTLC
jgi:hypothetical protein